MIFGFIQLGGATVRGDIHRAARFGGTHLVVYESIEDALDVIVGYERLGYFLFFMPIRRTLAVGKDVLVDVVAQCGQVRHVEVPVDLPEAAVLVSKVTALAIGAELLAIELSTILRLVLVIDTGLLLLVHVQRVVLTELF